jgi:hypothetical protein
MSQAKIDITQAPPLAYEVFGRHLKDSYLYHLGMVMAPNMDLAKMQAVTTYDEHPWGELCIVPSGAFVAVLGPMQQGRVIGVV